MGNKKLKFISSILCVSAIWIGIYWYSMAAWNNILITTNKKIPAFEKVINDYREKTINSFEETLNENVEMLKEWDAKIEWEWNLQIEYWTTKGTFWFEYTWAADSGLNNALWAFSFNLGLKDWNKLDDELPEAFDIWASFKLFLEQANIYTQAWNAKIESLKNLIFDDEEDNEKEKSWTAINNFLNKFKWRWIEFNKEKICDENSESYSEEWCETIDSINKFRNYVQEISKKKERKDQEVEELTKLVSATLKAWSSSLLSTRVLINPELVNYQWKQAYKFNINESELKKDINKIWRNIAKYEIEKIMKKRAELIKLYEEDEENYEDDEDPTSYLEELEEDKKEMLEEAYEWLNKLLESIHIEKFVGYIVYNEKEDDFDLIIENLEITYTEEIQHYNYAYYYNNDEEKNEPEFITEKIIRKYRIWFNSAKQSFVFVAFEDNKVKGNIKINYKKEENNYTINMTLGAQMDDEFLDNMLTSKFEVGNKKTKNTIENNLWFELTLNKAIFNLEEDITIGLNTKSKASFWEKFERPSTSNAIPFHKFEQEVEKLKKELETPRDRDRTRRSDLSSLWYAIYNYKNNEWKYPETNSNKMVSIKNIENEVLKNSWLESVPTDPKENNKFTFDWKNFIGEYWYKLLKKNWEENEGYLLMARTETPELSNYVVGLPLADDTVDLNLCWEITKWTTRSIATDHTCTYTEEEDLRYIYHN